MELSISRQSPCTSAPCWAQPEVLSFRFQGLADLSLPKWSYPRCYVWVNLDSSDHQMSKTRLRSSPWQGCFGTARSAFSCPCRRRIPFSSRGSEAAPLQSHPTSWRVSPSADPSFGNSASQSALASRRNRIPSGPASPQSLDSSFETLFWVTFWAFSRPTLAFPPDFERATHPLQARQSVPIDSTGRPAWVS